MLSVHSILCLSWVQPITIIRGPAHYLSAIFTEIKRIYCQRTPLSASLVEFAEIISFKSHFLSRTVFKNFLSAVIAQACGEYWLVYLTYHTHSNCQWLELSFEKENWSRANPFCVVWLITLWEAKCLVDHLTLFSSLHVYTETFAQHHFPDFWLLWSADVSTGNFAVEMARCWLVRKESSSQVNEWRQWYCGDNQSWILRNR